jgi:hypothetical protein
MEYMPRPFYGAMGPSPEVLPRSSSRLALVQSIDVKAALVASAPARRRYYQVCIAIQPALGQARGRRRGVHAPWRGVPPVWT